MPITSMFCIWRFFSSSHFFLTSSISLLETEYHIRECHYRYESSGITYLAALIIEITVSCY